jgi:competence protein ComEA
LAVEWFKNQWLLAKTGDKSARRKLLLLGVGIVVTVALLISGQTQSEPIRIKATKKSNSISVSQGFVHISGAVKSPGVYPIGSGMRLFEVVALAGGFTAKAAQDSVNLARLVSDGEQIMVSGGQTEKANDGLIHINRATAADFDKLPGIGPTLSNRIIDWRKANGMFKSVEDLRKIGGIGDKLFAGLKQLVTI